MWRADSLRVMVAAPDCVYVRAIVSVAFSPSDGWKDPGQPRGAEYNQKSTDTAENHHSLMITWLPPGDPALWLQKQ